MENSTDKIKDQIEDLKQTITVCEHIIAFEPISLSSQELLAKRIETCELKIQGLKSELFADTLYNICNPVGRVAV